MSGLLREVQDKTVHASPTVVRPSANPKRGLIIATLAGLFMTFIGALGTGEAPFLVRLGYWMLVMETGALIGIGVSQGVHQWGRLEKQPVIEGALISFLIAVPLSIVVISATALFFGPQPSGILEFVIIAGVVFVVSCVVTAINYATAPAKPVIVVELVEAPAAAPPVVSLFMERLPMRLRHARLIAIEAEDHYLRVHTDAGSDLVLMRLGDAVAELDGMAGARTHRSWWVARDAVVDVQNAGGRTTLILGDGLVAPVSRNSRPLLATEGWLS
jgi:hypothetical protein